ncbi:MAG: hypothetical protein C0608_03875 [Deltaproteobacteria bacterium]|nr:MAG: hypothetical protein C0608_03875 [Deltaproteobacteria bacterium]
MPYKVLDIYKDLPRTNCGDCGKSGCFAFATVVYLEGVDPAGCPHIPAEEAERIQGLVIDDRSQGGGKKAPVWDQALAHLQGKMEEADLAELAKNSGSAFENGVIRLHFLNREHTVRPDSITVSEGPQPSVWVKIFIYIYLTRANGAPPKGEWAAFRELPNSVSKSHSFEACAAELADLFSGRGEALAAAVKRLGGVDEKFGSADRSFKLKMLPRVDVMLLFWEKTSEFPARATFLIDKGILDYLDQEAIVFMAEALVKEIAGESINEVIP